MHCLPMHTVDVSLDELPTPDEVKEAIKAMKSNKACGLHGIPVDVLQNISITVSRNSPMMSYVP